ncbi:dihydroneopterin aldolase [Salinibacterium sp. M195]|uniref:dihydroneopterin aldolase n=1 Tax=Salinibacterium sp. M195 TaxID=2583374 RepID=UPI001C62A643|nr:dihydroneopterin aldolase [Salinibacterium sp. M195]QYH35222.1 dihydroneopterin aldolase [Salinibacterium sp. M195]
MNPALDELTLTGLRATAFHGVFDHERRDGQVFIVDATVYLDLAAAARTDELTRTIHYGELAEEIVAAVESNPVDLIETVAERIAAVVLAHEAAVSTKITLHKPSAPITVPFDDVSVTITRHRAAPSHTAGFSAAPQRLS